MLGVAAAGVERLLVAAAGERGCSVAPPPPVARMPVVLLFGVA